ncbi:MAG: transposase [Acidimicrobiales bacterium]
MTCRRSSAGSTCTSTPNWSCSSSWTNRSAHKSQPVRDWLARKERRRWHLHFTPTSSSWLNLVECWFSALNRKASTNTSVTSVAELEARIDCWVSHWNDNPEHLVWTNAHNPIVDGGVSVS